MQMPFCFQAEVSDDSATLYLSGTLSPGDAFTIGRACAELPDRVRTLRLDLHGLTRMEDEAFSSVRGVLRCWSESRGGSFRVSLTTDSMVATYGEGSFAHPRLGRRAAHVREVATTPALMAMYL